MHDLPGGPEPARTPPAVPDLPVEELVWPSDVWGAHLADCVDPRRCPHIYEVRAPDWWVGLMAHGSQVPLSMDPAVATALAMKRINFYRGGVDVTSEAAQFAREITRDALPSAPQPVSKEWVSSSLATFAAYAAWAQNNGIPLNRKQMLTARNRARWLAAPESRKRYSDYTRRTYSSRLDIIAAFLQSQARAPRANLNNPLGQPDALEPLTPQTEADVWWWAVSLRPADTRDRLSAVLALGLGVGAHRREIACVRAQDVTRDEDGVRVAFPTLKAAGRAQDFPPRSVTCSPQWEDRLWDLASNVEPTHLLCSPWRANAIQATLIDSTLYRAMGTKNPPRHFTIEMLRNTWVIRHLEAGTRLDVLMEQAAIRSAMTVEKLRIYLPAPTEAQTRAWMRGQRP